MLGAIIADGAVRIHQEKEIRMQHYTSQSVSACVKAIVAGIAGIALSGVLAWQGRLRISRPNRTIKQSRTVLAINRGRSAGENRAACAAPFREINVPARGEC